MKHRWSNEFDPTVKSTAGIRFFKNGLFFYPIKGRAAIKSFNKTLPVMQNRHAA